MSLFQTDMLEEKTKTISQENQAKSISYKLWTGHQVVKQLENHQFKTEWDSLYDQCPWATIYQSYGFIASWYTIYKEEYLPVLLVAFEGEALIGLLAMCQDNSNRITGAGLHQAEYQTWLSKNTKEGDFIKTALTLLVEHFPQSDIQLKFVPDNTPLTWVNTNDFWERHCWVQAFKHPVMEIDGEKMELELKKKNKKGKINRLKRRGNLSFERIDDYEQFEAVFDELATQNDFRKGAVYNASFFRETSLSKKFLLMLFKQGLLHATVLKIDDEIIASNVGAFGKGWVHLQGINTHAPSYAKQSPGMIHFLMLGKQLAKEGVRIFDLTPGADAYKDSLATAHLTAYVLHIDRPARLWARKLKYQWIQKSKSVLASVGINHQQQRNWKRNWSKKLEKLKLLGSLPPGTIFRQLLWHTPVEKKFKLSYEEMGSLTHFCSIKENDLDDLLNYHPNGTSLKLKWEFLEEAMKMLEEGKQCFTIACKNHLLCCVWAERVREEPTSPANAPPGKETILLTNLYFHPDGAPYLLPFLRSAVQTMVDQNKQKTDLSILLLATGNRICQILEKSGLAPDVQ